VDPLHHVLLLVSFYHAYIFVVYVFLAFYCSRLFMNTKRQKTCQLQSDARESDLIKSQLNCFPQTDGTISNTKI